MDRVTEAQRSNPSILFPLRFLPHKSTALPAAEE